MKTIIIKNPIEFNFEAKGEKWRQGEKLSGVVLVKNNGAEKVEIPFLKVMLLSGIYKKVKVKDPKAFEPFMDIVLSKNIAINGNEVKEFPFEFMLPHDCRITDKDGSVYLALLDNDESVQTGNMELNILPKIMLTQFLEIMDNFIRFKIGPLKSNKGMIEVKLTPPTSKDFSQVEGLVLKLKEVDKNLVVEYHFTNKKIEMNGSSMTTSKVALKFDQTISFKEFYIYGDSVNQDGIIVLINSILNEVKPKFMV